MSTVYPDGYNWKAAEDDVEELGGDVELIQTRNEKNRDSYLRELGLNPKDYKPKENAGSSADNNGNEGCYIATCVYGSYDSPEVWTLRRFRDQQLAKTMSGKAFIRAYYSISPALVRWFGNRAWFRTFWRGKLDVMVDRLQKRGFSHDPYKKD